MSTEKEHSSPQPVTPPAKGDSPSRKKSVVIYIMILFIAAFLLMALSSLMHQRSNIEALGKLQNSVTAMQEVQANQEKIIELQDQLVAAEDALDAQERATEEQLTAKEQELSEQAKVLEAMTDLYRLQQAYSRKDYEACQDIFQHMEVSGSVKYLPTTVQDDSSVTPPSVRYEQFKEAVQAIQALGE